HHYYTWNIVQRQSTLLPVEEWLARQSMVEVRRLESAETDYTPETLPNTMTTTISETTSPSTSTPGTVRTGWCWSNAGLSEASRARDENGHLRGRLTNQPVSPS
ncbi:MAG TPA: hypothetical protein DCR30_00060, partial [Afipia sp.]|nr:hypothetical protein [Afipia sp.]